MRLQTASSTSALSARAHRRQDPPLPLRPATGRAGGLDTGSARAPRLAIVRRCRTLTLPTHQPRQPANAPDRPQSGRQQRESYNGRRSGDNLRGTGSRGTAPSPSPPRLSPAAAPGPRPGTSLAFRSITSARNGGSGANREHGHQAHDGRSSARDIERERGRSEVRTSGPEAAGS